MKVSVTMGAAVAMVAGCGSPPPSTSSSSAAPSASPQAPGSTPSASAEAGTVIDISIDGGAVTPTNAEAQAVAGQPIVLKVSSDAVDSLHVHSVPENVF
ncbi:MAG: hypothetical protein K2Y33_01180, partial [Mycolicibacterium frederiksbergense]|nr:hypothetical protein [Mycolicibacterium frederiksbergense]